MKEKVFKKKSNTNLKTHTNICKKKVTGKCSVCENKICGDCGVSCKEEGCFLTFCIKHLDDYEKCNHSEITSEESEGEVLEKENGPTKKFFSNKKGTLTFYGTINIDESGKIGTDCDVKIEEGTGDQNLKIIQKGIDINCNNSVTIGSMSFGGFNQVNSTFSGNSSFNINGMTVTGSDLEKLRKMKQGGTQESEKTKEVAKEIYFLKNCAFKNIVCKISGSCSIDPKFLNKERLSIDTEGSCSIELSKLGNIFKFLETSVRGSGTIKINDSTVSSMIAKVHGSGDIYGKNTIVKNFNCDVHGSGDIEGFIIKENGNLVVYGSGDINCYKENSGTNINKRVYGSGDIKVKKIY